MKILIADDDRVSREFLLTKLRNWGDEVIAVADGAAAWNILKSPDAPHLAILDWMMPGMDGPELCRRVRRLAAEAPREPPSGTPVAGGQRPYTYLLIVTARGRTGDLVKGLEAGADDYLVKPLNPHELRARLQTGRRILGLQEELLAAQAALREKASRDALTGLWNRGTTLDILTRELAARERSNATVTILLADLDNFKRVNDTYGHLTGDAVLRETARRMRAVVRQTDWVGRYGGEEFLIVLPGCNGEMGVELGERVRHTLMATPVTVPEGTLKVTMSVGVAWADAVWDGSTVELLRQADEALYRAKQNGRNRVEPAVFEDELVLV